MIDFPKMKKVVLKEFKKQAKFIKDCFLSFENFEPQEILSYLPVVQKIQQLFKKQK